MTTTDHPNVLLVVADDLRFSAIGEEAVHTPQIDRLADDGCAFTHAHNMGSPHGTVCAPARAMLHSGRSLFELSDGDGIPPDAASLPERFAAAGYRTFATGKWHHGPAAFNRCYDEGRNLFFGGMADHWNVPLTDRHPIDSYPLDRPHRQDPGDPRGVQPFRQICERYGSGTHSSELFAETMIEFLTDHAASHDDRPVFAHLAFTAPHDPRTAPGAYHLAYDPDEITLPPNAYPAHPFETGSLQGRDETLTGHPRDPAVIRQHIADYYAMISHLDTQFGRVYDTLERVGMAENTIVVFTADHGLALGQHGLLGKQNLYDHSVRVPLILAGPGVPSGERRNTFTLHQDLYPTLCALAGISVPEAISGRSLSKVIRDNAQAPHEMVYTAFSDRQRALRTAEHKLIEYFLDGDIRRQLFDVEADPYEHDNLAEDPAYTQICEHLSADLAEHGAVLGDPLFTNEP